MDARRIGALMGGVVGVCVALVAAVWDDLGWAQALYRACVVGVLGAWAGFLLGWLHLLLTSAAPSADEEKRA